MHLTLSKSHPRQVLVGHGPPHPLLSHCNALGYYEGSSSLKGPLDGNPCVSFYSVLFVVAVIASMMLKLMV